MNTFSDFNCRADYIKLHPSKLASWSEITFIHLATRVIIENHLPLDITRLKFQ